MKLDLVIAVQDGILDGAAVGALFSTTGGEKLDLNKLVQELELMEVLLSNLIARSCYSAPTNIPKWLISCPTTIHEIWDDTVTPKYDFAAAHL